MKRTLTLLFALVAIFSFAPAQSIDWTKTTTPPIGTVYELTYTSSGDAFALSGWTMYEVTYQLPFQMDVRAGHGFVWGTRLDDLVTNSQPVWGYGAYVSRDLGGTGKFFFKASAAVIYDPNASGKRTEFVLGGSFGIRF